MKYFVKYGKRKLGIEVDRKRVRGVLAPRAVKPVADVDAAVRRALRRPVGAPPLDRLLKGRKTALIIIVDHTRPSPRAMLLPILDLCEDNGVAPSVIIATGRHRQMTQTELRSHLGADVMHRARILQHDPFDARRMVQKGRTSRGTVIRVNRAIYEHDVVIGTGIIEPSYLAGFSGGRKLLMPGLAYHESVDNNHFYLTHPDTRIGRLHGNPVSDDAAEFAAKLPLDFIVYEISGPNDEVAGVVAGHAVDAPVGRLGACQQDRRREIERTLYREGATPDRRIDDLRSDQRRAAGSGVRTSSAFGQTVYVTGVVPQTSPSTSTVAGGSLRTSTVVAGK